MAIPNQNLIAAIRRASIKLKKGSDYQWGHMGKCNCGHLAQELTQMTKDEIHQSAMLKCGDWTEQVLDYCPTSSFLMDHLISLMLDAGLDRSDLIHLEKLSSPLVLSQISPQRKPLYHNLREDVVIYMETWAEVLEEKLLKQIKLADLWEDTTLEAQEYFKVNKVL